MIEIGPNLMNAIGGIVVAIVAVAGAWAFVAVSRGD